MACYTSPFHTPVKSNPLPFSPPRNHIERCHFEARQALGTPGLTFHLTHRPPSLHPPARPLSMSCQPHAPVTWPYTTSRLSSADGEGEHAAAKGRVQRLSGSDDVQDVMAGSTRRARVAPYTADAPSTASAHQHKHARMHPSYV